MHPLPRSLRHALAACALALPAAAIAQAPAAWPSRTIQVVVPFTPGTGSDILARLLWPRLAEQWKVAIVTDNRPGASGNIGAELVSRATPDGYTLLGTATTFGTNPAVNRKLAFDPIASFAPVILLATSELSVCASMQAKLQTVRDLVEAARAQPGKLHYSSPGNGTPQHLAMELLKLEGRFDVVHVPYKGSGGAVADLIAGHVDAMIIPTQTAASAVQGGKLRMLGVMSARRNPAFPHVATLGEQGMPGIEVATWYGLFAPAGTPGPVVSRINEAMNELLRDPAMREALAKQGMVAAGGTPEAFGRLLAEDMARWRRVVDAAGIRAD